MTPSPLSRERDIHRHNYGLPITLQAGLEPEFRRAVRQAPSRQVSRLAELPGVALARHTRTFHQLDAATVHWRRL